jgi:arylsulfatase A-like enzyme
MSDPSSRPNVLVILTDQQRFPTPYEPEELRRWRHDEFAAERRLHETDVSFTKHYAIAAACAPSRASLLTGQYPSLHGVTQTDGLAKTFDSDDMFWLSPDTVPTMGDWFRARRLSDILQGLVARLARRAAGSRRRGLSAVDRSRRPERGEHRCVSRGRPPG